MNDDNNNDNVLRENEQKYQHFAHCSKSSFSVQKFNFDFPKKFSTFWGEKLAKFLWFWAF